MQTPLSVHDVKQLIHKWCSGVSDVLWLVVDGLQVYA